MSIDRVQRYASRAIGKHPAMLANGETLSAVNSLKFFTNSLF